MQTDVKVEYISDTAAADTAYVAAIATPDATTDPEYNIPLKTTGKEFSNGSARQLTFTSAGTITSENTVTVTGTGYNDQLITEDVTLDADVALATSINYFKTIISAVGAPPTVPDTPWVRTVSIGMSDAVLQSVLGRIRLKGYSIANGAVDGPIFFFSGGPASDGELDPLSFQAYGYAAGNVLMNYPIPGEGILYENGVTVAYSTTDSGAPIRMMNLYYG